MDSSHVTYGKLHGISGYDFRIVLQEQEAEQPHAAEQSVFHVPVSPVSVTSDCEAVNVIFMCMELASVTRDMCLKLYL